MALKVRFDPQAKRDLSEIRKYLLAHAGEGAADKIRVHLRTRFKNLANNPNIGVATDYQNVRVLAPTRYPYRIYYTVTGGALFILHIRHTARRDPDFTDLR